MSQCRLRRYACLPLLVTTLLLSPRRGLASPADSGDSGDSVDAGAADAPVAAGVPTAPAPDASVLAHPLAAITPPAAAADAAGEAPTEATDGTPTSVIPKAPTGFVSVIGGVKSQPKSVPLDLSDYSAQAAFGAGVTGTAFEHWQYLAYLIMGISADADTGTGASLSAEQITVAYAPNSAFTFQAGYMRVPFSLAQSKIIVTTPFPTRPVSTSIFTSGSDAGFLSTFDSAHVHAKLGLFEGISLGLLLPGYTTRGLVLSSYVDIEPFDAMPTYESDFTGGALRLAFGGGVLFRPATEYDTSGYSSVNMNDVRVSAALRFAVAHLYAQGEYLQDNQTDSLSARPRITRAAYGQTSYYLPIKKMGMGPLFRFTWSEQQIDFDPISDVTFEAGLNFYPRGDLTNPSSLRFLLEVSNSHVYGVGLAEQGQTAYGFTGSALYSF